MEEPDIEVKHRLLRAFQDFVMDVITNNKSTVKTCSTSKLNWQERVPQFKSLNFLQLKLTVQFGPFFHHDNTHEEGTQIDVQEDDKSARMQYKKKSKFKRIFPRPIIFPIFHSAMIRYVLQKRMSVQYILFIDCKVRLAELNR